MPYTVPLNPKEYIDLSSKRNVPVIASFNIQGNCVPLYFRYIYEDGTHTDIAIDRIVEMKRGSSKTSYVCDVTTYDIRHRITLVHFRDRGLWSLNVC